MSQPKVSISIPIYNVSRYLRRCLDSVISQTLKDIEIICINDGSTDDSLDIIKEYAAKDPRIVIIDKENEGYGKSMNRGFDKARGEYLGIIESDDYAEPEMFETLYKLAREHDLDYVKSGFYFYWSEPNEKNIPENICPPELEGKVFAPEDIRDPLKKADLYNIKPSIWSAIYRADFIRENDIRFNETPGASYQDAGFNFKVWACVKRAMLLPQCFLHYRQDNEASSINSPGKVYCVCDEYAEMERYLSERPMLKARMEGIRGLLKYNSYVWNYERLNEQLRQEFLLRASEELKEDMLAGYLEQQYFPAYKWNELKLMISNPEYFQKLKAAELRGGRLNIPPASPLGKLKKLYRKGRTCLKQNGAGYTFSLVISKLQKKLVKS